MSIDSLTKAVAENMGTYLKLKKAVLLEEGVDEKIKAEIANLSPEEKAEFCANTGLRTDAEIFVGLKQTVWQIDLLSMAEIDELSEKWAENGQKGGVA